MFLTFPLCDRVLLLCHLMILRWLWLDTSLGVRVTWPCPIGHKGVSSPLEVLLWWGQWQFESDATGWKWLCKLDDWMKSNQEYQWWQCVPLEDSFSNWEAGCSQVRYNECYIWWSNQSHAKLFIAVMSFTELGPQLLKLPNVDYLLSEVFSQDHLEHYSCQRHCGGSNDNPTAEQDPLSGMTLIQQQAIYRDLKTMLNKRSPTLVHPNPSRNEQLGNEVVFTLYISCIIMLQS